MPSHVSKVLINYIVSVKDIDIRFKVQGWTNKIDTLINISITLHYMISTFLLLLVLKKIHIITLFKLLFHWYKNQLILCQLSLIKLSFMFFCIKILDNTDCMAVCNSTSEHKISGNHGSYSSNVIYQFYIICIFQITLASYKLLFHKLFWPVKLTSSAPLLYKKEDKKIFQ